jgi:hypothetical protein
MKRGTYFRLLILSLFSALILSALSLFLLNRLTDLASSRHRNEFISFFVENIERKISTMSDADIRGLKSLELLELPFPFRLPRGFPPGPPPGWWPDPSGILVSLRDRRNYVGQYRRQSLAQALVHLA